MPTQSGYNASFLWPPAGRREPVCARRQPVFGKSAGIIGDFMGVIAGDRREVGLDRVRLSDIRRSGRIHAQQTIGRLYMPGADTRRRHDRRRSGRGKTISFKDIGAAADFAADEAALVEQGICAPDRADCHTNVECEVALGRQLFARCEQAIVDVAFDPVSQAQIERAGSFKRSGKPTCHGDNYYIDGN